nr:ATP-binding protein [uncultured Rhodoferax sp.]
MSSKPTAAVAHSLRARLLVLLFSAVVLTATVQALVAYRTSLDQTNEVFDYQMEQMALSLRKGLPIGGYLANSFRDSTDSSFEFLIRVTGAGGKTIFQSSPSAILPPDAAPGLSRFDASGKTYTLFSLQSGEQFIQVAQDLSARHDLARKLALKAVSPIAVMVPFLILLVWWVVSASLAPAERVRGQLAVRRADELTQVSEEGLPAEIAPLVRELNLLLHRVRNAFEAQKHFIADAAHELRSPLSALKLQVEGLRRANDASAREVAIGRLAAGIDRATRLVEQLLVLARQQAGPANLTLQTSLQLADLVQSVVGDLWETARTRRIDMGLVAAQDGMVMGHSDALNILVRNLLDNAIKYTPEGGTVNVSVRAGATGMLLTVEDSGPGVPATERARLFDRFYRVSGPQSGTPGSGLGLAIVKTIADMHGARITLGTSQALGGLEVSVAFDTQRAQPGDPIAAPR